MPEIQKTKAKPEPKIIHYYTDEWNHRWAIFDNGRMFTSRNKGVAGKNYDRWVEVDLVTEIKKDIGEK